MVFMVLYGSFSNLAGTVQHMNKVLNNLAIHGKSNKSLYTSGHSLPTTPSCTNGVQSSFNVAHRTLCRTTKYIAKT